MKMNRVILILFLQVANALNYDGFMGCFKNQYPQKLKVIEGNYSSLVCKNSCFRRLYAYALMLPNGACSCSNALGEEFKLARTCHVSCQDCPLKDKLVDAYATGYELPGPPQELNVSDITEHSAIVTWKASDSSVEITAYEITARVLETIDAMKPVDLTFEFSNNTYNTELNLIPCTKYNITLCAVSKKGKGFAVYQVIETPLGFPDSSPSSPVILKRDGKLMTVHLEPVMNTNGPTSAYQVAVVNKAMAAVLDRDKLKSYSEAMDEGLSYYITAEITPQDIYKNFTVGDGRMYGSFVNPPLDQYTHYQVLLGIVSRLRNVTKISWSGAGELQDTTVNILPVPDSEGDTPGIIIGLSIGIAILACLLVIGIIGFFILTRKMSQRRRRLTDNQELTMQGPIIEIENNGFILEDETVSTDKKPQVSLWSIPQGLIKIEPTNCLGIGKFGRVNSGTVVQDSCLLPVSVYTIQDRKLGEENRRLMVQDLDILLCVGKHENLLQLIGTCEAVDTIFVVLEQASMNLKDLLLGSRDALPGRFSNMQELQALNISVGVANGMKYLESLKVVHKQLCARNILITYSFVPKVSGYGIAQYNKRNMVPDYTRWMAAEIFNSQNYYTKCDVWSFACLLWEICVLGGTPYGSVPNNEIPIRIIRGLRLNQLRYISDDLYQLMLNCWQLDLDERPTFNDLVDLLQEIAADKNGIHLNFNVYAEFQYEQFYPDMELAARTVF